MVRGPIELGEVKLGLFLLALFLAFSGRPARADDPKEVPAPLLKPGETWVFDETRERGRDGFAQRRLDVSVERVGPNVLVVDIKQDGSPGAPEDHAYGSDWSQRRNFDGTETIIGKPFSFPLTVGKTWTNDYVDPTRHGLQTSAHYHKTYKVAGWEDVTVPAGAFHALKIEMTGAIEARFAGAAGSVGGALATPWDSTAVSHSQVSRPHTIYAEAYTALYYVPQIDYYVKSVDEQYDSDNVRLSRTTQVLVSHHAGP